MNSSVAPRSLRRRSGLAPSARSGVPWVAASPREQTTKCAGRPARVSRATTPPQPNSMSSGCAPKASSGRRLRGGFGVGFIGPVDGVADDVGDLRRVLLAQVVLLAGAGDVMGAVHDRLHPAQPRVARRADLLLGERHVAAEVTNGSPPLCSFKPAVDKPGAHDLAFVGHIHK